MTFVFVLLVVCLEELLVWLCGPRILWEIVVLIEFCGAICNGLRWEDNLKLGFVVLLSCQSVIRALLTSQLAVFVCIPVQLVQLREMVIMSIGIP